MTREWQKAKLDDVLVVKRGQTITKKDAQEGPYPVILGGKEPAYYIDKFNHTGKAIVISRSGASAGYVSFWNQPIFVTDGFLLEPKDGISYEFLYHLLKSKQFELNHSQRGAAIPHVTPALIKSINIVLPPSDVREQIASILSAYDSQIENNQKRIRLLEQMAENIYKEWFVRFRFPGYKTAEFEGGVPKGWTVAKLDHCVEVCYGKDHKKIEDGDIPIFGSGGVMRYGNKALFDGESVLIPRKGSLNNVMYYNGKAWTVDTMFYTKMLHPYLAKYLYYTLSGIDLASFNSGAALPSMTTDILYHFKIVRPNEKILKMFDDYLCPIYDEIDFLNQQNNLLVTQRDLLLPRLMSGKLSI